MIILNLLNLPQRQTENSSVEDHEAVLDVEGVDEHVKYSCRNQFQKIFNQFEVAH